MSVSAFFTQGWMEDPSTFTVTGNARAVIAKGASLGAALGSPQVLAAMSGETALQAVLGPLGMIAAVAPGADEVRAVVSGDAAIMAALIC
jgi:hypothetical protein